MTESRWRGIDHLGIAVPDLEAARELFTERLGFRVVEEEEVAAVKVAVAEHPGRAFGRPAGQFVQGVAQRLPDHRALAKATGEVLEKEVHLETEAVRIQSRSVLPVGTRQHRGGLPRDVGGQPYRPFEQGPAESGVLIGRRTSTGRHHRGDGHPILAFGCNRLQQDGRVVRRQRGPH